jgi:hypothetical protein
MLMGKAKRHVLAGAVLTALGSMSATAQAACTFGASGEPTLQGSLTTLLGAGAPNATGDCISDGADAAWTTVGSVGAIDIVLELAGNASTNSFGVYDLTDPTRRLSVFEGNDGVSSQATVRLRQFEGGWRVSVLEQNNADDPSGWTHLTLSTSAFGFYLGTLAQGTFFSNTTLNSDGVDHLYAYRGTGTPFLSGPLAGEVFSMQDYLLAWEDLAGGGDRDYQDFAAIVEDVKPVPLPTAVWLLASGLIGLAGVARRRSLT